MKIDYKFKWKWYGLILVVYNLILPIKPTSPFLTEFIVSYGASGFFYYLKNYPITFFINPLIIFLLISITIKRYRILKDRLSKVK